MQNLGDCTCSSYVYTSVTCILAISEFLCYSRRCKDVSLCTPCQSPWYRESFLETMVMLRPFKTGRIRVFEYFGYV